MNATPLKTQIIDALWETVDQCDAIISATLTGSFVNSENLEGLSDIDFVVIVDELNKRRFDSLQASFSAALQPILARAGYEFQLNPTLGPLKFNAPKLAVLHLMVYSRQAHIDHVVNSPFTCLDWQRSQFYRKQSMSGIYPAFGLQPRHFLSARRSISDYLHDFRHAVVSYRELICDEQGYVEMKRAKPMNNRDRHEFAYHVMRFLMLNLLKLVRKHDFDAARLDTLLDRFFEVFPNDEDNSRALLTELARKKRHFEYDPPSQRLAARLEQFVGTFEEQFRCAFFTKASRHVAFRHAATEMNLGETRFVGRSNPSIVDAGLQCPEQLRRAIAKINPRKAFTSPLQRCQQSLQAVWPTARNISVDQRLLEIDYGKCEALTISESQTCFPRLFESWQRSEDPRFPGGENSADVTARALSFVRNHWDPQADNSIVCTHNVVLRSLVGEALGVPAAERHRIMIPHLLPIEFVSTEQFGLFVDLDMEIEKEMCHTFAA